MIGFPTQKTNFKASLYHSKNFEKNFDKHIQSYLGQSKLLQDKKEEWKFFPFQKVFSHSFDFESPSSISKNKEPSLNNSLCLQVKNGIPSSFNHPSIDLISFEEFLKADTHKKIEPEVQKKILSCLKEERNHFSLLNNVFYPKGFILICKEEINQTIEIHYSQESASDEQGLNLRNFIFVKGQAKVLEFFHSRESKKPLFLNVQTDGFVEEGSLLEVFSFDALHKEDTIIHQLFSHLEKKAKAYFFHLSLEAGLSRWLKHIEQEEESVSHLRGLSLLSGSSVSDQKTRVKHKGLRGESDQFFKSFVFDKARSIFQGLIHIAKTADESDTKLLNKNYLFSPHSSAVSFPELDIYPANVQAAHGSTISPFFENNRLIFYLKSRGIDPYLSFHLVLLSLLKETFADCSPAVQNLIKEWVEKKLLTLEESLDLGSL